jgi:hypothetical protein
VPKKIFWVAESLAPLSLHLLTVPQALVLHRAQLEYLFELPRNGRVHL